MANKYSSFNTLPRSHTLEDGKAMCLVFTFTGQLHRDKDPFAPEHDFFEWMFKPWLEDIKMAGVEAAREKSKWKEREVWRIFHEAIQATGTLMHMYRQDLPQFRKVAARLTFLPCFLSWHPENQRFNRVYLKDSCLSQHSMASARQPKGVHLAKQSWPVRYAYAIVNAINLTLDYFKTRLPEYAERFGYGIRHPVSLDEIKPILERSGWSEALKREHLLMYKGSYRMLPAWAKGLEKLHRPLITENVQDYWQKGKEMILEEMPEFHLRPEWEKYRERRNYKDGAKKGVIQHAIFKDILIALKTIAGANNRRAPSKAVTK
jgi:hypothetical protein